MPRRRTLKDYLLPHSGNRYKPLIFTASGVAVAVLGLLFVQAAYLFQTSVVFTQTNFLASVLPGVLSTLANEDREKNGAQALTVDPLLEEAARLKAADMAARGYFSHVDPDGRAPWYWLDKVGYQYTYAGENLAIDFVDSEDVEEAWMDSPTHRANIVKPQYTRIGIGTADGVREGQKTTYVVQFFATPRESGVATTGGLGTGLGSLPANGKVLGAQTEPITDFLTQVVASPTHTVIYVLGALVILFTLLLVLAVFMHARVQYLEVIGGGLVLILMAGSLLIYNALSGMDTKVPESGEAAVQVH